MGEAKIKFFPSDDALAAAVARDWLTLLEESHRQGHRHLVALSGGRVTKKLFSETVRLVGGNAELFGTAEFFWADERCLPPNDPESNYRLANELLFQPLQIKIERIHRIRGEDTSEVAAQHATNDLVRASGCPDGTMPVLDLVLLGMGEDGHVASLFPRDAATASNRKSVFLPVGNSPKPPPDRVSLSHGAIAAASQVWVLASGKGKETALKASLSLPGQTPLASVIQNRTLTRVFTDISLS